MENDLFTTFQTSEGQKIISKTSIAAIEEINQNEYRITLKELNEDGVNISFVTTINYKLILNKLD
jgi:hypothetical protein